MAVKSTGEEANDEHPSEIGLAGMGLLAVVSIGLGSLCLAAGVLLLGW